MLSCLPDYLCAAFLIYGSSAEVSVSETEPMKLSSTGPDSTCLHFFMAGAEEGGGLYDGYGYTGGRGESSPFIPPDGCPDEILEIQ